MATFWCGLLGSGWTYWCGLLGWYVSCSWVHIVVWTAGARRDIVVWAAGARVDILVWAAGASM